MQKKVNNNSLAVFTRAEQMLAKANTIQEAKELKDLALTAADWARRKGMGQKAIQHCQSYSRRAEIKLGEMLAATERAKGTDKAGKPKIDGHRALPSNPPPTLAELGLSKREASEAQMLAVKAPKADQNDYIEGRKTKVQIRREVKAAEVHKKVVLPESKYTVLYADPPWKYGDKLIEGYGAAEHHYPPMSIEELCALPISRLAENDAVLFLWVTSPFLMNCAEVIRSWGFTYKASFVWDKVKHNYGHYNSVRHEFLLLCTRGTCLPQSKGLENSVQRLERSKRHSEKPEEFRALIERMYPIGKKIELFGRKQVNEWDVWGNQIS